MIITTPMYICPWVWIPLVTTHSSSWSWQPKCCRCRKVEYIGAAPWQNSWELGSWNPTGGRIGHVIYELYMSRYIYIYIRICICICIYICVYIYMYVYVYVYVDVYVDVYVYICIYMYIYIHVCVCVCRDIYNYPPSHRKPIYLLAPKSFWGIALNMTQGVGVVTAVGEERWSHGWSNFRRYDCGRIHGHSDDFKMFQTCSTDQWSIGIKICEVTWTSTAWRCWRLEVRDGDLKKAFHGSCEGIGVCFFAYEDLKPKDSSFGPQHVSIIPNKAWEKLVTSIIPWGDVFIRNCFEKIFLTSYRGADWPIPLHHEYVEAWEAACGTVASFRVNCSLVWIDELGLEAKIPYRCDLAENFGLEKHLEWTIIKGWFLYCSLKNNSWTHTSKGPF